MSFRSWFRHWMQALFFLFTLGTRPYKSERQRKKERERRKKAKYRGAARYRVRRKVRRRVRRHHKTLFAITNVLFWTLCVLLLPIGIFDWGYQSAKQRRKKTDVGTVRSGEKTRVEARAKETHADDRDVTASPTQKPKNSPRETKSPPSHACYKR